MAKTTRRLAVTSWLSRPGLLRTLLAQIRLAVRLIREPRVPALIKAVPLLAALYIVWPLDVIPDVIPVLGQLDDLGIAILAIEVFLKLCPADARAFHERAIADRRGYSPMGAGSDFIDAEWRRG